MIKRFTEFIVLSLLFVTPALAAPPTALVIISCQTDDHTGEAGRQNPIMAAKGWRDLEWKILDGELQCKRDIAELEDSSLLNPLQQQNLIPLTPDFSVWSQCAAVAMHYSAAWNEQHKGWAVLAVGCPTPITDHGKTVGYKMPECPSRMPGTDFPMRCNFDESAI
jgi:hypothetical protein